MRQFTVEVLPKFPARVDTAAGIKVTKANGVYTFSVDYNSVGQVVPPTGAPTKVLVQLPDGSYATMAITDIAAANFPVQQTGKRNVLINGGFAVWQRGTTFVPTTVRMLTADRWGVKTAAGTLTSAARGTPILPARAVNVLTITGNAGVTTVDIDQRLEAGGLNTVRGPVTFSALITNATGAAFTPTLFVDTPTVQDTWTTSNAQNNAGAGDALQSIAGGATVRVSWSANISAYANIANGVAFRLRFPSGALNANTKSVSVSEVQVEPVTAVGTASTLFESELFGDVLLRCQRYYCKTFPYATAPAQNAGVLGAHWCVQGVAAVVIQSLAGMVYPVVMRTAPTLVTFNPSAANIHLRNIGTGTDWSVTGMANGSDRIATITSTTPAGSTAGQISAVHLTADAEL